ncbi:hypothetical protein BLNAU_10283 [Blattamonas nauphoetae]|uniref:Uncharacterized protein n=1 Tax=Blattamonas nauphoetae TaxID=2049346 RepID=A0ABQ9XTJ1_9EUKA|nr:hypothetical protein BLNAU_10283 [Blattamonas nauphoetae]
MPTRLRRPRCSVCRLDDCALIFAPSIDIQGDSVIPSRLSVSMPTVDPPNSDLLQTHSHDSLDSSSAGSINRNHHLSSWKYEWQGTLDLLARIIDVSVFHQPTLDFTCSSHIPLMFQSLLSKVENDWLHQSVLSWTSDLVSEWQTDEAETVDRGRIVFQTLEGEGFRDQLDQVLLQHKESENGEAVRFYSFRMMNNLGMNSPQYHWPG